MNLRTTTYRVFGVLLLGLGGLSGGCGTPASDTGPAEEPNIGPGAAPGVPSFAAKGDGRANTSASAHTRDTTKK